jgi:hypothetical protein
MTNEPRGLPDELHPFGLEWQLRRMPAPQPPPELERRLLADIPKPSVRRETPWRHDVLSYALAAALFFAVIFGASFMIRNHDRVSVSRPHPGLAAPQDTSPQFILGKTDFPNYQETRPCDILPPFVF